MVKALWKQCRLAVGSSLLAVVTLCAGLGLGLAAPPEAWAQSKSAQGKKADRAKSGSKATAAPTRRNGAEVRSSRAARPAAAARATPRGRVQQRQPARALRAVRVDPPRLSVGQLAGLHHTDDPLDLKSSVALVMDQDTNEVLFSKNPNVVLPIASLTKLMTALVVAETSQPLDEMLTITQEDVDTEKGSRSRLSVGTQLSRGEMLHLALMSSENRAAHALGRHYPGGMRAFVSAMNAKAQLLGMTDTDYVEPTGLSSRNRSSARDLANLVQAAYGHRLIREMSISAGHEVEVANRSLAFRNTNGLVFNPEWTIGLQKTGYISEAGRCLVMQASLAGRQLIMVLLDSAGRYSRLGDAERIRRWVTESVAQPAIKTFEAASPAN
jgi:serine-type D-Ala-D-Ala endopeptidase (penicillin-binding protein 7)